MSVSVKEDFPEKVKPKRAFGLSSVGVRAVLLGPSPGAGWSPPSLLWRLSSKPQFHFMFPSSWPVWIFVPQPPGARGTCLPTFHFSFDAAPCGLWLAHSGCLVNALYLMKWVSWGHAPLLWEGTLEIIPSFYRWRNWGSERANNLPKVKSSVCGNVY